MISIRDLYFSYGSNGAFALRVPDLHIGRGEKIAIIGPSGVGKTTLASLIAGILTPQRGEVVVDGVNLAGAPDHRRRDFRIANIGFVFQEFELVDYLPVRDNILLPYYLNRTLALTPAVRRSAGTLAASMGLGAKLRRYPRTLSQGEKQRVAICRALATSPKLLIADEPTGNLDPKTSQVILDLLMEEVRRRRATLVMVTHNHHLLDAFDRTVDIEAFAEGAAS